MRDGFLGNNASFMLDVVVCALVLVVPVLLFSLYLVKVRRNYVWHRNLQILLGVLLLLTVAAFEIDMQLVHGGWENIVAKRQPPLSSEMMSLVRSLLRVHLIFATSTPVLWAATLILALKRFPSPPAPAGHSRFHKILGWLSTIDLVLTSFTGLMFYYAAFIAG